MNGDVAAANGPEPVLFDLKRPWVALLWAAVFAVSHTQAPLYYSNQNQYFVHGLAEGGLPYLDEDWLANTRDPTPLFSGLVAFTYRHLSVELFHVYFFALLMTYFLSLLALCARLPGLARRGPARFAFLTLLVVVHAAVFRLASVRLSGVDYPWYLQCGVANQYLLGPGLQPSAFGVLLIASLAAFLADRLSLAAVLSAAAATVHSTYLLPAALLTGGYLLVLAREGRRRSALLVGAGSLVLVLPVVAYNVHTFGPSSAETFQEAERLLAEVRIPHHALVSRWLDGIAAAQIGWALLGLFLLRGTRLCAVLSLAALAAVLLSVLQVVTGSDTLALLFPWRISAVLVPIGTAVILARLTGGLSSLALRPSWLIAVACSLFLLASVAGGVAVEAWGLGYHMSEEEVPLLEYVREHKRPGEVYLLPVTVPKVGAGPRGTASTSFTPPPRSRPGVNLIPVDLQRFRLFTGAPIYVDFKSVPYKDTEVLEWYARLERCQRWYERRPWGAELQAEWADAGITHVVTTASDDPGAGVLERAYADDVYRVYRVRREAASP